MEFTTGAILRRITETPLSTAAHNPAIYQRLEEARNFYAICLPANAVLREKIAHRLTWPVRRQLHALAYNLATVLRCIDCPRRWPTGR